MPEVQGAAGLRNRRAVAALGLLVLGASCGACTRKPGTAADQAGPAAPADVPPPPPLEADGAAGTESGTPAPIAVQDPELARRLQAAAATTEPYARWLMGLEGGGETWPPAWAVDVMRAAAVPQASVAGAAPDLTRTPDSLVAHARLQTVPEREPCAELAAAVRASLAAAGFSPMPGESEEGETAYESTVSGIKRVVAFTCRDAHHEEMPGCTPPCTFPASVTLEYGLALPAPPFGTFTEAFAPYPMVLLRLRTTVVPEFLAQRMSGQSVQMMDCEALEGVWCANFTFFLAPPADVKGWVVGTIDEGAGHGFVCDERYKDPERDWISSTQDCSGMNLGYNVQNGRLMVHLGATIGGARRDNAVNCSRDFRPPADAGVPDPDVLSILDMPVTRRTSEHIQRVVECWSAHQRDAGREPQALDWSRAGGYLKREAGVAGNDRTSRGIEVGTNHETFETQPADGFYARARHPLEPDGTVELYVEQDSFAQAPGRFQIEFKDANGATQFTVGDTPDLAAGALGSEAELSQRALANIDWMIDRELAGVNRVQDCRVLPNMGQQCDWRETTAQEQEAAKTALEARRTLLHDRVRTDAAAMLRAVADLYPFADPACALSLPVGPP
ncbi:MAG: hypothetical protein HY905_04460 [Deltaproteobacteria bacterium]|nr:hypothetical protein [Deltaproteobacteria bacterium]